MCYIAVCWLLSSAGVLGGGGLLTIPLFSSSSSSSSSFLLIITHIYTRSISARYDEPAKNCRTPLSLISFDSSISNPTLFYTQQNRLAHNHSPPVFSSFFLPKPFCCCWLTNFFSHHSSFFLFDRSRNKFFKKVFPNNFFKRCDDVIVGVRLCQFICFLLLLLLSLGVAMISVIELLLRSFVVLALLRVDLAKRDCRLCGGALFAWARQSKHPLLKPFFFFFFCWGRPPFISVVGRERRLYPLLVDRGVWWLYLRISPMSV